MAEIVGQFDSDPGHDEAAGILVLERLLPASPDRVFDAWVDPSQLGRWWGPEGATASSVVMDVRPGGAWRTVIRIPDGTELPVSGAYREIRRPDRLVFTWAWEDDKGQRGHETEIALSFEPSGAGTRMRLEQRRFESAESRDQHRMGWSSSFDDLERFLA